jgi:Flp pilus assembly pilin Flp
MTKLFLKNKGQEAIEFVLISALVFFAAIFSFILLGDKLGSFFHNDSAAVKVANQKAPVLDPTASQKFNPDIATIASNSSNPYNTTSIDYFNKSSGTLPALPEITDPKLKEILINSYPDDIKTTIATTGASGGTESITKVLDQISAYMDQIAAENPDNTDFAKLADQAHHLAYYGHIVADAQEWVEMTALNKETGKVIHMPADNLLCQDGSLKSESKYCDTRIDKASTMDNEAYSNIDSHTSKFMQYNESFQELGAQYPELAQIIQTINVLSYQIDNISDTLSKATFEFKKEQFDGIKDKLNLEDIKNQVASETTDIKSDQIKEEGDKIEETAASADNSTTP